MFPSLNYRKRDLKFILLGKVFKYIDGEKAQKIYSRNNVKNIKMMIISIKIVFMTIFFDYELSKTVDEINRNNKLKKFLEIDGEVPEAGQVYEYLSRYSTEQYTNIVNSILKLINKTNRNPYTRYIVDATPVACDINHVRKYVTKEKLEKLNLKWGYSTTKGHYIGFKVTMVLDEKSLCPVSILIHSGAPHDSKLFEEILKELQRRRIIKPKNIILFDRGYYSYKNYQTGINKYKIIPVIFPKNYFNPEKLEDNLSYPLDVFKNKKKLKQNKSLFKSLKNILLTKLNDWKELKPIRGKIEDFFKVAKEAFGLGQLHKYTTASITRHVYLCILLTTITIQNGYKTKTQLQQLAEGNIELKPVKKVKNNKNKDKTKKKNKQNIPKETKQPTLIPIPKEKQTTIQKFLKI